MTKPEFIKHLYYDKNGHNYSAYKCPECTNFFKARKDLVDNGNTQSCGCLKSKHARKLGLANKKKNTYFFPIEADYGVGYYNNKDGYFIFSLDKYPIISQYNWTAKVVNNRVEPVTTINGKTIPLSRFLMETPVNLDCDHVNHNTNDARMCNLRNCTTEQNQWNKANSKNQGHIEYVNGKYVIKDFSKCNTDDLKFDSEEEATAYLYELQDEWFGDFSFRKSQEIATENEINQFTEDKYIYFGVLDEINQLPKRNVFYIRLNEIRRWKLDGKISEDNEMYLLLKLIEDYKADKKFKTA